VQRWWKRVKRKCFLVGVALGRERLSIRSLQTASPNFWTAAMLHNHDTTRSKCLVVPRTPAAGLTHHTAAQILARAPPALTDTINRHTDVRDPTTSHTLGLIAHVHVHVHAHESADAIPDRGLLGSQNTLLTDNDVIHDPAHPSVDIALGPAHQSGGKTRSPHNHLPLPSPAPPQAPQHHPRSNQTSRHPVSSRKKPTPSPAQILC
jgi:hypothetical protein